MNKNVKSIFFVLAILAIGHPDEEKVPYQLDELHYEKVHYEKF